MDSEVRVASVGIVVVFVVAALAGCRDGGPGPSRASLTLRMPAVVEGRYSTCASCEIPVVVVVEFPVVIGDPAGPGGVLERLETLVVNSTRGVEIVRTLRPNADVAFRDAAVPPAGSLTVQAGAVFSPPPPRDDVRMTVRAWLTDGRSAAATSPLAIGPAPARAAHALPADARDGMPPGVAPISRNLTSIVRHGS